MSDQGPAGIESNPTSQQLDEPMTDDPGEGPVTSKATACLKCPIMSKKLISYQKENSRMRKTVVELKERLQEMERKLEDVRLLLCSHMYNQVIKEFANF